MTLIQASCLADPQALLAELQTIWRNGDLAGLALPQERHALQQAVLGGGPAQPTTTGCWPEHRPALVLGSGGSSGGRRWCLQPLSHLQASADACGAWLRAQAIDPERCLHLNALPLHHVSGLMPLVRVQRWGAALHWLPPALLRQPELLPQACPLPNDRPVLLSLVPTQLQRLLECPGAVAWLARCAVIWVGGAALTSEQAQRARAAELPLAPCYGATETAAMVCALPPRRFLAGEAGCGPLLDAVELRLEGAEQAIALRTGRLSPGWFVDGRLEPFAAADGWWRSGDAGEWLASGSARGPSLVIRGRLDGAILSGGETVFPEQLEQQLLLQAREEGLGLEAVLLLGVEDPPWGQRLVALVKPADPIDPDALLSGLIRIAAYWPAPQRPRRWLICPGLGPEATGKWARQLWRAWLAAQEG